MKDFKYYQEDMNSFDEGKFQIYLIIAILIITIAIGLILVS